MITTAEHTEINRIKAIVLAGNCRLVGKIERQWVLDLMARENQSMSQKCHDTAQQEGLSTDGVAVGHHKGRNILQTA